MHSELLPRQYFDNIEYVKTHLHLKKSSNQAHLEEGNYEQIVLNLEKELEINALKVAKERQINTVTQQATKPNPEKPTLACRLCKKPGLCRNQCRQLKKEKDQNNTKNIANSQGCLAATSGKTCPSKKFT